MQHTENIPRNKVIEQNSIALAFLGDAVHSMFAREKMFSKGIFSAHSLHVLTAAMVNASSQAFMFEQIENELTDEEKRIAKNARNTITHTNKNHDQQAYQKATSFEAVIGFLWATGDHERVQSILEKTNNALIAHKKKEKMNDN